MEYTGNYFLTILQVFLTLSSILIIFMFIKFIIVYKKNKNKKSYGFRSSENYIDINKSKPLNKINIDDRKIKVEENKLSKNEKIIKYDSGEIYKGEVINGKRSGFGICVFSNGDRYEGLWKEDMINCVGKYIFSNGSTYTGDFKNEI